jgi:hypothetical protein
MDKTNSCKCGYCEIELKKACFSPQFCKPCSVKKNSEIKVCKKCGAVYEPQYQQCPSCSK